MAAFQATETPRARTRASADPSGSAVRCSVSSAAPNPARPEMAFASTAAVAGPPIRRCKISMRLAEITGKTASTPLPSAPILKLKAHNDADEHGHHTGPYDQVVPGLRRRWHAYVRERPHNEEAGRENNQIENECSGCSPVKSAERQRGREPYHECNGHAEPQRVSLCNQYVGR